MKLKGHAAVELALLTPFFAALLTGFLLLARVVIMKQRSLAQARLGTLLYASGLIAPENIRELLVRPGVTIELDRYREGAAGFYHFVQTRVTVDRPEPFHVQERVVCQGEPES